MKSAWVYQTKRPEHSRSYLCTSVFCPHSCIYVLLTLGLNTIQRTTGSNFGLLTGRIHRILRVLSSKLRLEGAFDFATLAKATPGYVGADLAALTGAAGIIAVKRIFQQLSDGTLILPDETVAALSNGMDGEAMNVDQDQSAPQAQAQPSTEEPHEPSSGFPATSPNNTTKHMPFANLNIPLPSPGSSILSFLQAHPDPLTEAQLSPLSITLADFHIALAQVQPSSKREGFATVPDVTWSDIGALHGVREELHMAIVQPIRRPELFKKAGIEAACGVLMWGPPGCGKTLLAKAVANESRANFISVKGPELLNKVSFHSRSFYSLFQQLTSAIQYVGESERAVRQVFSRARASSPCIIFFDELDALVPRRDDSLVSNSVLPLYLFLIDLMVQSESSARVVNTLLTELDGLDARKSVYVIAATNRPDMIDPAMCRPGRLDKLLYVDLPTADERAEIFGAVARKVPFDDGAGRAEGGDMGMTKKQCIGMVKEQCDGYSGADITALVREAGVVALRRALGTLEQMESTSSGDGTDDVRVVVTVPDFRRALEKVQPSVSVVQRRRYEALRSKFAGLPVRAGKEEDGKRVDGDGVAST
jgi:ribosome biogenesis ATPase